MEKENAISSFITALIAGLSAVALISILSVFDGTILWLIWPIAIPAAFPKLVTDGILAPKLPWWSAVCLTWLFTLLIKTSQINKNNKKKSN